MSVQFLGFIGEEGENMCEFAALSTDTLPVVHQGKPLAPGSIANIYASKTATPTFKRFIDLDGTGNAWVPFIS